MSENRRRRPVNPPVQGDEPVYQAQPRPQHPHHEQPYEQPRQQPRPPRPPRPEQPYEQPRYEQPPSIVVNQIVHQDAVSGGASYFDGGLLQLIGYGLLAFLIITFTLGLGYPFAACMLYRWEAKHTVINGRRLRFDGTATQLIGKWILWLLLTLITFGIYGLWLSIKLKQWRTKHTHFA